MFRIWHHLCDEVTEHNLRSGFTQEIVAPYIVRGCVHTGGKSDPDQKFVLSYQSYNELKSCVCGIFFWVYIFKLKSQLWLSWKCDNVRPSSDLALQSVLPRASSWLCPLTSLHLCLIGYSKAFLTIYFYYLSHIEEKAHCTAGNTSMHSSCITPVV